MHQTHPIPVMGPWDCPFPFLGSVFSITKVEGVGLERVGLDSDFQIFLKLPFPVTGAK
jgi:hypothetical protein